MPRTISEHQALVGKTGNNLLMHILGTDPMTSRHLCAVKDAIADYPGAVNAPEARISGEMPPNALAAVWAPAVVGVSSRDRDLDLSTKNQ